VTGCEVVSLHLEQAQQSVVEHEECLSLWLQLLVRVYTCALTQRMITDSQHMITKLAGWLAVLFEIVKISVVGKIV